MHLIVNEFHANCQLLQYFQFALISFCAISLHQLKLNRFSWFLHTSKYRSISISFIHFFDNTRVYRWTFFFFFFKLLFRFICRQLILLLSPCYRSLSFFWCVWWAFVLFFQNWKINDFIHVFELERSFFPLSVCLIHTLFSFSFLISSSFDMFSW